eukprot:353086-Chlamydomonas_euryale.AAC.2
MAAQLHSPLNISSTRPSTSHQPAPPHLITPPLHISPPRPSISHHPAAATLLLLCMLRMHVQKRVPKFLLLSRASLLRWATAAQARTNKAAFLPPPPRFSRLTGWRPRRAAFRWSEAACRNCARGAEAAQDHAAGRGDVCARRGSRARGP